MKTNRVLPLFVAAFCLLLLILDGKTALYFASDGLDMCMRAVIPSLFPFFFLTTIINDHLLGANSSFLRPLGKLCKIPYGSESLLLLGLIGGYPVGATSIYEAYRAKSLTKDQATRMLSFCNNAGPAFLFGMLSHIFDNSLALWVLWLIHILSAVMVGILLPGGSKDKIAVSHIPSVTPKEAMQTAVRNIGLVCGWIILFRIIFGFLERWFLWLLPSSLQILLGGVLELSNGCLSLSAISCKGLRFLFAAVFLSFGGFCVAMQTASVIGNIPMRAYIFGKLIQTTITVNLAGIAQVLLFPSDHLKLSTFLCASAILLLFILLSKKAVAFPRIIGYNDRKSLQE